MTANRRGPERGHSDLADCWALLTAHTATRWTVSRADAVTASCGGKRRARRARVAEARASSTPRVILTLAGQAGLLSGHLFRFAVVARHPPRVASGVQPDPRDALFRGPLWQEARCARADAAYLLGARTCRYGYYLR